MSTGPHRVPAAVAWTHAPAGHRSARVYVAPLPHGPIHVLDGTAALIWHEALRTAPVPLPDRVAAAAGVPVESVREDVEELVGELVARGLLVPPDVSRADA